MTLFIMFGENSHQFLARHIMKLAPCAILKTISISFISLLHLTGLTYQWQPIARSKAVCNLGQKTFCNKAAAVHKSCLYVLYGQGQIINKNSERDPIFHSPASLSFLFRFNQTKDHWEQKVSTKTAHFGSSPFVVGNNLCVAGEGAHSKHQMFH